MNILDIRTVLFSYSISNAICIAVIAPLWNRNRGRTSGLGFWLADFVMQFLAILLIALRGILPDFVSILFGTPLILIGTLFLYIGLERYVGKTSPQRTNFCLIGALILAHAYFTFGQPSLQARNLIFSFGLLLICCQCAWLLLQRVDRAMRPDTKVVGVVLSLYALVSVIRLCVDATVSEGNDLFKIGIYDVAAILVSQMLFIGLTFALILMLNRRQFGELEKDIAALKGAEEKNAQLAAIVESSDDAIIGKTLDETIISWNRGAERIYGYTEREIIGKPISILAPPERKDETVQIIERIIKGEYIQHYETIRRRKDGQNIDISLAVSPIKDLDGKIVAASTIGRDITDQKRAEKRLVESETRYRSLFENMLNGFAYCQMLYKDGQPDDFIYLAVNAAFEELTGLKDVTGKKVSEVIPGIRQSDPGLFEIYGRVALTGQPETIETFVVALKMWFSISVYSPQKGYFVAVFDVITERKQIEADLRNTLKELKRSNTDLEQFAYVASHDLREPLRMVSSYMDLLERRYKGKLDKDADEFIGFAVDGAERMQRLINDLLAYSRLGTSSQPFAPASCEAALGLALGNLKLAIQDCKARISHDPLPEVIGDEAQLVQLFQNLVGNAIKFHGEKAPFVQISAEPKGNEWVFSVEDNGIGIDPQYAERIFIIFQRLQGRDQYEGTGIGLASCKRIVERHGGRIWVESTPGNGATFFFTLPKNGGERL